MMLGFGVIEGLKLTSQSDECLRVEQWIRLLKRNTCDLYLAGEPGMGLSFE